MFVSIGAPVTPDGGSFCRLARSRREMSEKLRKHMHTGQVHPPYPTKSSTFEGYTDHTNIPCVVVSRKHPNRPRFESFQEADDGKIFSTRYLVEIRTSRCNGSIITKHHSTRNPMKPETHRLKSRRSRRLALVDMIPQIMQKSARKCGKKGENAKHNALRCALEVCSVVFPTQQFSWRDCE